MKVYVNSRTRTVKVPLNMVLQGLFMRLENEPLFTIDVGPQAYGSGPTRIRIKCPQKVQEGLIADLDAMKQWRETPVSNPKKEEVPGPW